MTVKARPGSTEASSETGTSRDDPTPNPAASIKARAESGTNARAEAGMSDR